jgi:hypothetical protein
VSNKVNDFLKKSMLSILVHSLSHQPEVHLKDGCESGRGTTLISVEITVGTNIILLATRRCRSIDRVGHRQTARRSIMFGGAHRPVGFQQLLLHAHVSLNQRLDS